MSNGGEFTVYDDESEMGDDVINRSSIITPSMVTPRPGVGGDISRGSRSMFRPVEEDST